MNNIFLPMQIANMPQIVKQVLIFNVKSLDAITFGQAFKSLLNGSRRICILRENLVLDLNFPIRFSLPIRTGTTD